MTLPLSIPLQYSPCQSKLHLFVPLTKSIPLCAPPTDFRNREHCSWLQGTQKSEKDGPWTIPVQPGKCFGSPLAQRTCIHALPGLQWAQRAISDLGGCLHEQESSREHGVFQELQIVHYLVGCVVAMKIINNQNSFSKESVCDNVPQVQINSLFEIIPCFSKIKKK